MRIKYGLKGRINLNFSHWLSLTALVSALILLWSLKEVIIQLFAGIVLAMALCTLINKLRSIISMPRSLALLASLITLGGIFTISLVIVVPQFTQEFQQLINQLPTAARELWELAIGTIDKVSDVIYGDDPEGSWDQRILLNGFNPLPDGPSLANGVGEWIKKILGLASNLGIGILQILFVIAVSLMIAIQPYSYREVAILLVPSFYRRRARSILCQCGDALSNWMVGVLISSLCVSILAGIGLSILGVKLVIANALLAGILNIIPNVGPVISTIFPLSVALLDAPWKAAAVLGMYIFIQNLESYLITPSVMHHQVKLLPGLTLTAQIIFTIIFGPIGLLLALPLTVVIQVLIREIIVHDLLDNWKRTSKSKWIKTIK